MMSILGCSPDELGGVLEGTWASGSIAGPRPVQPAIAQRRSPPMVTKPSDPCGLGIAREAPAATAVRPAAAQHRPRKHQPRASAPAEASPEAIVDDAEPSAPSRPSPWPMPQRWLSR